MVIMDIFYDVHRGDYKKVYELATKLDPRLKSYKYMCTIESAQSDISTECKEFRREKFENFCKVFKQDIISIMEKEKTKQVHIPTSDIIGRLVVEYKIREDDLTLILQELRLCFGPNMIIDILRKDNGRFIEEFVEFRQVLHDITVI